MPTMRDSTEAIISPSSSDNSKTVDINVSRDPVEPAELSNKDPVDRKIRENLERFEHLFGTDEDAFAQPTTNRRELWSYYLYYNGDNGVGPLSYSQALFQSALTGAGMDPNTGRACEGDGECVIPWPGGTRAVSSVVLIANGISFSIMTVIFIWLGSAADYGYFGRWLLLGLTVICWAFQYGFMSVRDSSHWRTAMGLYIVSLISYGATLVFYAALFPRLARYMPHVRKAREEDLKEGNISQAEYEKIESLERNHISNVSTAHSNIGYLLTLAINLSVLLPMQDNSYSNNWAHFLTNTYWVVLGIWWFIFQQRRPGPKIPKGSSYTTIGFKQIALALREIRHLPQTFIYLFAFFLLADGLNTTGILISIIQNDQIEFSFLQLTYLGLTQAICSIASTLGYWYIQRYFKIRTKPMFMFTNFFTVMIPLYGMIGLWTTRIGYHNRWEFYFYNIIFGLFQAPYYSYAQTMMSEVTPRGYEGMFFGLYGLTNRASSIIGPNVVQAIINDSNGNNWMGFPFLFALCVLAMVTIWFVDVEKGREDCRKFVEERKMVRAAREAGMTKDQVIQGAVEGNLTEENGNRL